MSIRSGILALLHESQGYGLQIHGELEDRTDRVGRINVGQIYSTLDRLAAAGLVASPGSTDDGLPLYALTPDGRRSAEEWMADCTLDPAAPWNDMVFKVLLATSLGAPGASRLIEGYRAAWAERLAGALTPGEADAAGLAQRLLAEAAIRWLDALLELPGGLSGLERPLRNERPRRGRRPASPPE